MSLMEKIFGPKKDADAWLNNEMTKPKSTIEFTLSTGEVLNTGAVDPIDIAGDSQWGFRYTSADLCQRHLERSYERGYFRDEAGVTYPVHMIRKVIIKVI